MTVGYLGLGSDVGDRVGWLRRGVQELEAAGLGVGAVSPLYLTEPVGDSTLPWFLNCAVEILDPPPPRDLLTLCLAIETICGRVRTHAGPEARTLDLDVLLYDQRRLDDAGLTIPHPRLHERRFALQPLADIAPDAVHPLLEVSVADLLANLASDERVWLLAPFPRT